jgi:hypothetical protein
MHPLDERVNGPQQVKVFVWPNHCGIIPDAADYLRRWFAKDLTQLGDQAVLTFYGGCL